MLKIKATYMIASKNNNVTQVILEKVIRIPRSLSHPASNVLKGFLNKNPQVSQFLLFQS